MAPQTRSGSGPGGGGGGDGQKRARGGGGGGNPAKKSIGKPAKKTKKTIGKPAKKAIGGGGERKGKGGLEPPNRFSQEDDSYDSIYGSDGNDIYDVSNLPQPDRKVHLDNCSAMRRRLELECTERFKPLFDLLERNGLSYREALTQLIEGNIEPPETKAVLLEEIAEYVAFMLVNYTTILMELLQVEPWDKEYVSFIAALLKDLKEDIGLTAPEIDMMLDFCGIFLSAPERTHVGLSLPMRDLVNVWVDNSQSEYEMMKKWVECPSWSIDTSLHDHSVRLKCGTIF